MTMACLTQSLHSVEGNLISSNMAMEIGDCSGRVVSMSDFHRKGRGLNPLLPFVFFSQGKEYLRPLPLAAEL